MKTLAEQKDHVCRLAIQYAHSKDDPEVLQHLVYHAKVLTVGMSVPPTEIAGNIRTRACADGLWVSGGVDTPYPDLFEVADLKRVESASLVCCESRRVFPEAAEFCSCLVCTITHAWRKHVQNR